MAGNDAATIEYERPRRRITDRAPAFGAGVAWWRLIKIGDDDDVAIRWWAARAAARRGPAGRR